MPTILDKFWEYWATFDSNMWSHWSKNKREGSKGAKDQRSEEHSESYLSFVSVRYLKLKKWPQVQLKLGLDGIELWSSE